MGYVTEGKHQLMDFQTSTLIAIKEYGKAKKALGDAATSPPECQYDLRETPFWNIISGVVGELPLVSPRSVSLRQILFHINRFRYTTYSTPSCTPGSSQWPPWPSFNRHQPRFGGLCIVFCTMEGKFRGISVR